MNITYNWLVKIKINNNEQQRNINCKTQFDCIFSIRFFVVVAAPTAAAAAAADAFILANTGFQTGSIRSLDFQFQCVFFF